MHEKQEEERRKARDEEFQRKRLPAAESSQQQQQPSAEAQSAAPAQQQDEHQSQSEVREEEQKDQKQAAEQLAPKQQPTAENTEGQIQKPEPQQPSEQTIQGGAETFEGSSDIHSHENLSLLDKASALTSGYGHPPHSDVSVNTLAGYVDGLEDDSVRVSSSELYFHQNSTKISFLPVYCTNASCFAVIDFTAAAMGSSYSCRGLGFCCIFDTHHGRSSDEYPSKPGYLY